MQAWDAADELILANLTGADPAKKILILGDSFGALSCALRDSDLTTYTDSFVSAKAISLNSQGQVNPVNRLEHVTSLYDLVLIKIPKNMAFLEDILRHLSSHLSPSARVICGAMLKHLPKTAFDLLNRYVGETSTSLAQKKARLIFACFEREPQEPSVPIQVHIEGFEYPFTNHSNLFSREKLDIGTRFLLENLPTGTFKSILDLGCGNGIIGIAAKKAHPAAKLVFSDDSQMAIQSAMINYRKYFSDDAEWIWTHAFEEKRKKPFDLVLCNPPFHQGHTLSDFIARQMFGGAHDALTRGGFLRVVGNSHLQYQILLGQIFGNSKIVAKNHKFTIIDAFRR